MCFPFFLLRPASSAERGQSSGSRAGREGPRTGSEELGPKDQEHIPGEHPASRGTLHASQGLGRNEEGSVEVVCQVWLVTGLIGAVDDDWRYGLVEWHNRSTVYTYYVHTYIHTYVQYLQYTSWRS